MLSCGPIERKDKNDPLWTSRKLAERKLFVQDKMRVQARTSAEEVATVAQAVAEKLNKHKNPRLVKFMIPLKGFSSLSGEGAQLYDPEVDQAFVASLENHLRPEIQVIKVDAHINSAEFGKAVTDTLKQTLGQRS
jgi:uncharacterized protein (UPF0261 family)